MERFLSQPFHVAEQFTGTPGQYVPIGETVRSFREVLDGKHDDLPESAFFMKGSIDDVLGSVKESDGRKRDEEKESEENGDESEAKAEGDEQSEAKGDDEAKGGEDSGDENEGEKDS
jgi:hypothetical protein